MKRPALKNFRRIVDWLEVPAEMFLDPVEQELSTPEIIARHLRSDTRLTREAASQIAKLVEDMYHSVLREQPRVAVHLRSAKTFTIFEPNCTFPVLSGVKNEVPA